MPCYKVKENKTLMGDALKSVTQVVCSYIASTSVQYILLDRIHCRTNFLDGATCESCVQISLSKRGTGMLWYYLFILNTPRYNLKMPIQNTLLIL